MVESGAKKQTVRPMPKRVPRAGDIFDGREWTGKPYRSKQRKLVESPILKVDRIDITKYGTLAINSYAEPAKDFAVSDGFKDEFEFVKWFEDTHGLPFQGIAIYWK